MIPAKPVLFEVVGILGDVPCRTVCIVFYKSVLQEEITVQTEDRLCIEAQTALGSECECIFDECELAIHKQIGIWYPGMCSFNHPGRRSLDPCCLIGLLIWREIETAVKILFAEQILKVAFIGRVVSDIQFGIYVFQDDVLRRSTRQSAV